MYDVDIINNDEQEIKKYHDMFWGACDHVITKEHIQALLDGKCIALNSGEYSHVIKLISQEDVI
jgi:hypothetical protein